MPKRDLRRRYRFKETLDLEMRKYRGRQAEVSRKADVKQPSLRYWADPKTTALPTVEQAYDIAKALGVTLEYLVTGEGDETPQESALSKQEQRLLDAFRLLTPSQRSQTLAMIEAFLPSTGADKQESAG